MKKELCEFLARVEKILMMMIKNFMHIHAEIKLKWYVNNVTSLLDQI